MEKGDMVAFINIIFFNSMINNFIFRCVDPWIEDYYYYFADQPTQYSSPNTLYNKKIKCHCLTFYISPEINYINLWKSNLKSVSLSFTNRLLPNHKIILQSIRPTKIHAFSRLSHTFPFTRIHSCSVQFWI